MLCHQNSPQQQQYNDGKSRKVTCIHAPNSTSK